MKTADDKSCKTPNEDLMNEALKHYEEAANAIHHFNSDIPKAIKAYASQRSELTDKEIEESAKEFQHDTTTSFNQGMYSGYIFGMQAYRKAIRDRQKGGKP